MNAPPPIVVVEVEPFPSRANEVWSDEERMRFIDFIARNPKAGVVIPDTGGLRKIRRPMQHRGKRGGARVIYYFLDLDTPLFLLTVYAKGERADLTPDQRRQLAALAAKIKAAIRRTP